MRSQGKVTANPSIVWTTSDGYSSRMLSDRYQPDEANALPRLQTFKKSLRLSIGTLMRLTENSTKWMKSLAKFWGSLPFKLVEH
jgi:hypothetical protein